MNRLLVAAAAVDTKSIVGSRFSGEDTVLPHFRKVRKMMRRARAFAPIVIALFVLITTDAMASARRTFVASTGNDANPCTLSQPCRGFAAAVAQTSTQGEVIVLDSAGYGPVAINQSVTLSAPAGIYAGISVFTGDGVAIDSPTNPISVRLVGLTIVGQNPAAANGISITGNSLVVIERCSATGMQIGLYVLTASGQPVSVHLSEFSGNTSGMDVSGVINISDTVASRNLNQGLIHRSGFIFVRASTFDYNLQGASLVDFRAGTPGSVAVFESSEFQSNSFSGIGANGYTVTLKGSQMVANGQNGVFIGAARTSLIESLIIQNQGAGIAAGTDSVVTLDGVTISDNHSNGVNIVGAGVVQTLQSNTIMNNTPSDVAGGALTPIGHQ